MNTSERLWNEKHVANAFVHIEGDELDVVSVYLEQEFGKHHRFKVVVDYDVAKMSFFGDLTDQIMLIGRHLDIDLQQGDDSGMAYEFRGVIDNVYTEGRDGKHGYLVIEGSSPTNLLERGKRLDIFADMSLSEIFKEVTDGVKDQVLSLVNKPVYPVPLEFMMQYYESDWEFLQRLSAISGETLFYTGRDLVFGQYRDWEPMEVTYDRELTNVQFGSRLLTNTFTNYQYLPFKDEIIRQESLSTIENSNEYLNTAAYKAQDMGKARPVLVPSPLDIRDQGSLDDMTEIRKAATAARTIYVKGVSKACIPRIGRRLTILMPDGMSETETLGTYRVIKVIHTMDENHKYRCEFEAIPASLKYFPTPELKMPVATSLVGLVIKNDDPDGHGRVRVEFPFARDRVSATWMRVMTPDAGSSSDISKNRGFVFIPEKGDQVMVGFEFGDPNRPYVMGSMFHGKNGAGGGSNNAVKSIITRSGHTIQFDDAKESLGITIKDINGNVIHLDSKGKNIEITAPETITMNCKNMKVNVDENMDVNVGKDMASSIGSNQKTNVGETIETSANEVKETIGQNATCTVGEKLTLTASETDMFANGGDFVVKSAGKALVQGATDARISRG